MYHGQSFRKPLLERVIAAASERQLSANTLIAYLVGEESLQAMFDRYAVTKTELLKEFFEFSFTGHQTYSDVSDALRHSLRDW